MTGFFLCALIAMTGGVAWAQVQGEPDGAAVFKRAEPELVKFKRCIEAEVMRHAIGTPLASIDEAVTKACADEERVAHAALAREGMYAFAVNIWVGYCGRSHWMGEAIMARQ